MLRKGFSLSKNFVLAETSNRLGEATCSSMMCEWFLQHGLQPSLNSKCQRKRTVPQHAFKLHQWYLDQICGKEKSGIIGRYQMNFWRIGLLWCETQIQECTWQNRQWWCLLYLQDTQCRNKSPNHFHKRDFWSYVGGSKIFWTGAAICTAIVLAPSTGRW